MTVAKLIASKSTKICNG